MKPKDNNSKSSNSNRNSTNKDRVASPQLLGSYDPEVSPLSFLAFILPHIAIYNIYINWMYILIKYLSTSFYDY